MGTPTWYESFELALKLLGGIAGLGTLGYAIYNMLLAQNRPTGTTTGMATKVLRTPILVIASILFVITGYIFWKPIPLQIPWLLQFALLLLGAVLFFPNLGLYIWGLRSLGENFNASSGFGVRLHDSHQLVTSGPYAHIRHPMYLAVILAGWGGLMIYLTWTMLGFSVMMLGVIIRAHREDQALAQEFGDAWYAYKNQVPRWFPKLF
jgi:protein-S-isoprenylcysteine O-methyltransferase Ste14